MLGSIEVLEQIEMTKMPQEAASAWSAVKELVGAKYKPIAYVGRQVVHGVNHVFIAEQTLITNPPTRHIATVKINACDGKYSIAGIEQII